MSRPKTKGPAIAFRLPLDVDQALREHCAERGETPRQFVSRAIERAVRERIMGPAGRPTR